MKPKKTLQKLTVSERKIKQVYNLKIITKKDIEGLNEAEQKRLEEMLTRGFQEAKGTDIDLFFKKLEHIISRETKNQIWERNHTQITAVISNLLQEFGRMPTTAEIADKTNLSRQTIHKHLTEYATHPIYLEQIEQFRFLTSRVLAKVFQYAVNGDTGAAKLYFNVMGFLNNRNAPQNTLIQNQNNYIQINGTVLSQETVKNLTPEQLNMIESILKTASPEPAGLKILNTEWKF